MQACRFESALQCHYYDRALTRIAELMRELRWASIHIHTLSQHSGTWLKCKEEPCQNHKKHIAKKEDV